MRRVRLGSMALLLGLLLIGGAESQATVINGTVTFNGTPVCAMVLANGQYMFTCSGDGSFNLDVPLDISGQITLFAFCSGLAPFQQTILPAQGQNMQIAMQTATPGPNMTVSSTLRAISTTKVRLSGTLTFNGTPICAMALANGQYMFTCSGNGSFSLDCPLDNLGAITLFGFCSGLPPYQNVFTTGQINFNNDSDGDGWTVNQGDCDDTRADVHPGAAETCGDGIDQDCDGSDQSCQGTSLEGTWRGAWYSGYGGSGSLTVRITQNGSGYTGNMDVGDTDCGDLSRVPITITAMGTNNYAISAVYYCQGSLVSLQFTEGTVVGNSMSGSYETYVDGEFYDYGTYTITR